MIAVLNEKTRENSKLKKESVQLLERLSLSSQNYEKQISSLKGENVSFFHFCKVDVFLVKKLCFLE